MSETIPSISQGHAASLFADHVHPRILFGPADIPALRRKVKGGMPRRALDELLRRCGQFLDPAHPKYVDVEAWGDKPVPGMPLEAPLRSLAFAWAFTGEARWRDRAIAMLRRAARNGIGQRWSHSPIPQSAVPLAYDILYDQLPEDDRGRVAALIRAEVEAFRARYLGAPARYVWGLGVNTTLAAMWCYAYWLAAAYDPAVDAAALREYADLMRRSLHRGIDQGGMIGEGPNYGLHDAMRWTVPAEILRRAGVADFWTEEPRLLAMLRHWAYLILPGRGEVNPIADAVRGYGSWPLFSHLLGARRTGDPVLQWIWNTLGGRGTAAHGGLVSGGRTAGGGAAPECFIDELELPILWDDEQAPALDPGQAGWPASWSSGDFAVNVMRSGWDDEALHFSLLGSGRTPGCMIHQHTDGGHFTLFALGEAFSIDTGYGDDAGRHHSVMMPSGAEPPTSPAHHDHAFFGGRTEAFASGRAADYCRVSAAWQWGCYWYYRHALVVRAPGTDPYVVLLDNVNPRNDYRHYEWLVNSEPGNRIETDQEGVRAAVHGKRNRLEIAWSYPPAGEYPVPHRMELAWDEIDSCPLDHVRVGLRLGIGKRPRLRATLWGYNGQLLSALMPRRAEAPAAETERIGGPLQFGLIIRHPDRGVVDTVVASPVDRRLSLAGMDGEATLAIVRRDAGGRLLWAAAADAFAFSADGRAVLPRRGEPVDVHELPPAS